MDLNNLTVSQAMEIIRGEGDGREFHQKLYDGDKTVKAGVEAAFAKADPERHERVLAQSGDASLEKSRSPSEYERTLNRQFAAWQAEQNQNAEKSSAGPSPVEDTQDATRSETPPVSSEPSAVDLEVQSILAERWGQDHAENKAKAGEVLRTLFPTVEAMLEFGQRLGLHSDPQAQAEILDLLASLNKK
jgi:hypothetical protein